MHCQVSYRLKDENLFVSREIKSKVATQTSSSLVKSINMLHASSVEPIEFSPQASGELKRKYRQVEQYLSSFRTI